MTDLTVTALINSMTSSDFRASDVYNTQQTAHLYCSSKLGEEISYTGDPTNSTFIIGDNQQAMAISMLASAILIEGRRVIRSRDENIIVRTIEQLFTDEMSEMLLVGDETSVDLIRVTSINPTDDWVV